MLKIKKKGLLITFEGNDGSGKTTQINLLKDLLIPILGDDIVFVREPGGNNICEQIREVLLDDNNANITPITEYLLYSASRAQLFNDIIKPALDEGKIVVCDRYTHSSIAYQGYGRELLYKRDNKKSKRRSFEISTLFQVLENIVTENTKPDLTIWLQADLTSHIARKGDDLNRMDKNGVNFNSRVEYGYNMLFKTQDVTDDNIVCIEPDTIEDVAHIVRSNILPYIFNFCSNINKRNKLIGLHRNGVFHENN